MTDKETLVALLTKAGIPFGPSEYADPRTDVIEVRNSGDRGYSGFVSEWEFDDEGKLLGVGNYE